jgi:hypothetical protein
MGYRQGCAMAPLSWEMLRARGAALFDHRARAVVCPEQALSGPSQARQIHPPPRVFAAPRRRPGAFEAGGFFPSELEFRSATIGTLNAWQVLADGGRVRWWVQGAWFPPFASSTQERPQ